MEKKERKGDGLKGRRKRVAGRREREGVDQAVVREKKGKR